MFHKGAFSGSAGVKTFRATYRAIPARTYPSDPDLSDPNRSDFESQIASDCDRNSKKFQIALRNACKTAFRSAISAEKLGPKSPESEILAKHFADMGEKRGENLAKFFADFRP